MRNCRRWGQETGAMTGLLINKNNSNLKKKRGKTFLKLYNRTIDSKAVCHEKTQNSQQEYKEIIHTLGCDFCPYNKEAIIQIMYNICDKL